MVARWHLVDCAAVLHEEQSSMMLCCDEVVTMVMMCALEEGEVWGKVTWMQNVRLRCRIEGLAVACSSQWSGCGSMEKGRLSNLDIASWQKMDSLLQQQCTERTCDCLLWW